MTSARAPRRSIVGPVRLSAASARRIVPSCLRVRAAGSAAALFI